MITDELIEQWYQECLCDEWLESVRDSYPDYNGEQSGDATEWLLNKILRQLEDDGILGEFSLEQQQEISDLLCDKVYAGLT